MNTVIIQSTYYGVICIGSVAWVVTLGWGRLSDRLDLLGRPDRGGVMVLGVGVAVGED